MEFSKVMNSKSKVWNHFTKNAQHKKANKCKKCGTILNITGGKQKNCFLRSILASRISSNSSEVEVSNHYEYLM